MKVGENQWAYCARHGEYLPDKVDAGWTWPDPEDEHEPRPEWVRDELREGAWDPDQPIGCYFIRLDCDEQELQRRVESLYHELMTGPGSGDDDLYDYWPSGALLFRAMRADAPDQQACEEMRQRIIAHVLAQHDEAAVTQALERGGLTR